MAMPRILRKLVLLSFLALAACESAEERAERYYQSGLTLLEAGDIERALIEFRNVLAADPRHEAARLAYADVQRERGLVAEAQGQYLQLIEQHPQNAEALIALAEIAVASNVWEDVETNGQAAAALLPEDDRVIAIGAMLDYRKAVLAKDTTAAAAASTVANQILERNPDSVIARKIAIDHAIIAGDIPRALALAADGLDRNPAQPELHVIRIGLLSAGEDIAGTQAAIEAMAAQFPDNAKIRRELIAWYLAQDDLPAAEAYLRDLAAAPDADLDGKLAVVDFLRQTQGIDAARGELERLIGAESNSEPYRAMRASLLFTQGQTAEAIAEMEDIIATGEETDTRRGFKVVLAQMHEAQGENDKARAYVTDVLSEDPGQIDALRMQAQWSIDADDPDAAIMTLRQALAQAPRDVTLITLLAMAHERAGDHDLAGERYALAVDISGQDPESSLRHARFLLGRERVDAAETVIANALTVTPQNVELLALMAEIQLRQSQWNRVTRIIWQLRALDSPETRALADGIALSLLKRQERFDQTRIFLEQMIADGATSMATKAQLVEAQIRAGKLDDARAFLKEQLALFPDDPTLRYLQADMHILTEDTASAEAIYRSLLEEMPENEHVLRRLYGMLAFLGRKNEADELLETVLAEAPDAMMANMIKASRLEEQGDFESAIAIYETLYARDSSNLAVANNLASLITARRDDPASVERADAIAARMRGTDVPQFQDTLGWIAYRRGDYAGALRYLERAASELQDDALTQYHLGKTYMALERPADARTPLERAVTLANSLDPAQLDDARRLLADLTK